MKIGDCYQILRLRSGASVAEVKASYRLLARQYHPDANPGDARSHDKFIQLHKAYKHLLAVLSYSREIQAPSPAKNTPAKNNAPRPSAPSPQKSASRAKAASRAAPSPPPPRDRRESAKTSPFRHNPQLSEFEKLLKQKAYLQLQELLRGKRFPRAIALVEGLARRVPNDVEVRQWQAITYQRWGRQLLERGQITKARIYLKKALRTDPHNRSLWAEVERDFRRTQK